MKSELQLFSAVLLGSIVLASSAALAAGKGEPAQPLSLVHVTQLPEIVGDFDHFAVDLKRNHLFVSAEVHHSVEMFDLQTGEHLQSIGGFKTPHSLAFVPEKDELLVADGGDSALILISGEDFHRINRIQLIDGSATGKADSPDAGYYDAENRLYYVGNGGVSANLPDSKISIFSVDQGKIIGDISIPGNNVESMGVDNIHHRPTSTSVTSERLASSTSTPGHYSPPGQRQAFNSTPRLLSTRRCSGYSWRDASRVSSMSSIRTAR